MKPIENTSDATISGLANMIVGALDRAGDLTEEAKFCAMVRGVSLAVDAGFRANDAGEIRYFAENENG